MIAIIPARGGSKGLPGKNIKELNGKPLIAYTIEAALESKHIKQVIVSTDDHRIAAVAEKFGAEIPFMRPAELAGDDSKAIDTYLYTIDRIEKEAGKPLNEIVVLLPTCPLRNSNDIDVACELYLQKKADSVVSYTKEHHPITWHKRITAEGKFEPIFPEGLENRQEIKETFYPNGSIYVFSTKLLKDGKYFSENSYAYIMPRNRSVDIDTPEDFEYAEFLLNRKNEK